MFEGVTTYPDAGKFWNIVQKYCFKSILYRSDVHSCPDELLYRTKLESKDLSLIKVLDGLVGRPINSDAWHWYYRHIGCERCPIVDAWWKTERGWVHVELFGVYHADETDLLDFALAPGVQTIVVQSDSKEISGKYLEGNFCVLFPCPNWLVRFSEMISGSRKLISRRSRVALFPEMVSGEVKRVIITCSVVWMT